MALGQVAAKIDAASDPDEVLNTMGNELRKLGVMCMVALHSIETQTLQVQYISLDSNAMASAEKVTGVKLRDHHLSSERFPFYEEVMEHGQSVFSIKPLKVITTSFSGLSRAQVQRFEKLIGLTNRTKSIFLPLIAREKVVGTLWMWGDNLLESDLSAATIFASQVAVTLENARLYREIIRLAVTDELTGLYNRRGGLELGQREFERAKRHGRALSAILLDIDHFKDVNDTHGHIVGDQVLKVLSERFGNHLRATDIAVRYGGEEFLVLLPEANLSSAYEIAERLRRLTADLVVLAEQRNIQISISAGVAERNPGMKELMALVKCADEALYLAKQSGRNQVVAT